MKTLQEQLEQAKAERNKVYAEFEKATADLDKAEAYWYKVQDETRKAKAEVTRILEMIAKTKEKPLVDLVLAQIVQDVQDGDITAVEELIKSISAEQLKAYLPHGESK